MTVRQISGHGMRGVTQSVLTADRSISDRTLTTPARLQIDWCSKSTIYSHTTSNTPAIRAQMLSPRLMHAYFLSKSMSPFTTSSKILPCRGEGKLGLYFPLENWRAQWSERSDLGGRNRWRRDAVVCHNDFFVMILHTVYDQPSPSYEVTHLLVTWTASLVSRLIHDG